MLHERPADFKEAKVCSTLSSPSSHSWVG